MRISGGEWRGQILVTPTGSSTRPTSDSNREALFNIVVHTFDLAPERVLDLFAGSGALSLEALSRGAQSAMLFEADPKACQAIEKNFERVVKPESEKSHRVAAERDISRWPAFVKKNLPEGDRFDLVFCDPPYNKGLVLRAMKSLERIPEVFSPQALLIAELASEEKSPRLNGWTLEKERVRGATRLAFYRRAAL